MKTSSCRECGKTIIWIKTGGGKSMPCDPDLITYWAMPGGHSRIVTPNGEVIACKLNGYLANATGIGYVPHLDTCPKYKRLKGRLDSRKGTSE